MIQEQLKWLPRPSVRNSVLITGAGLLGFVLMTLVTSSEGTLQESTLTEQTLSALGYVRGDITPTVSVDVLPGSMLLNYKEPATIHALSNGVITLVPGSPKSYRLELISPYVVQFQPEGGSIKLIKDRFKEGEPVLKVEGRIAVTIYYRQASNEIKPVITSVINNPQEHKAVIDSIIPKP